MSKKGTPRKEEIARARGLISSTASDAIDSADLRWARRTLAGEDVPSPGEALRPEVAYALVEELIARRELERLGRLAQSTDHTVAKAARTGLHLLRSQKHGVEVPLEAEAPHQGTGYVAQQAVPGFLSVYDDRWDRLIWLGDKAPSGVTVFQARVSALYGLVEFRSGTTSRKRFRELLKRIAADLGGALASAEQAKWFIFDAARRAQEAQRSLPGEYAQASQLLGHAPPGAHPALELTPAHSEPPELMRLLELPELRHWHPDRTFLSRLALRLEEAATSRIVLSDEQKQDRFATVLERSIGEFFTAERCRACRVLLLDTAHLSMLSGLDEQAARLRAAADLFALSPEQVVAHPFARALIERAIRRPHGGEPDSEPPMAGPGESGESGLILPGRGL